MHTQNNMYEGVDSGLLTYLSLSLITKLDVFNHFQGFNDITLCECVCVCVPHWLVKNESWQELV